MPLGAGVILLDEIAFGRSRIRQQVRRRARVPARRTIEIPALARRMRFGKMQVTQIVHGHDAAAADE